MAENFNVLFVITDQQRADHLGCAGNTDLKTPNIDALASEGVRFTNAYCANPMCMPNRATIFTGKYPSVHGVRCNGINLDPAIPTFTQALVDAGYQTCSFGKIHLNWYGTPWKRKYSSYEMLIPTIYTPKTKRKPLPKPYYGLEEVEMTIGHGDAVGGDYLDWIEEKAPEYLDLVKKRSTELFDRVLDESPLPEELYQTSYITEKTVSFLERYSDGKHGDKPFFVHCSFPDPHHPTCPPGRFQSLYDPDSIEISSTLNEIQRLYRHRVLKHHINIHPRTRLRETTEEELRKFQAYSYGLITLIDNSIGKILAALISLGLEKNTIVIFTSDHADLMGDHGMLLKGPAHYQGLVKVPYIWKVPGITKAGRVSDALVSSIDIPKTILELLNIKRKLHPPGMQGFDITPILEDPSIELRDCCLIEEDEDPHKTVKKKEHGNIRVRTLVTKDYRLSLYEGWEDFGDLYDLKRDPNETNNLWFDKDYKDLRDKMVYKMTHEILKLQDQYPKKQAQA
ncbi:MAG: sulfatase-like hydrolase/transferase [Candidatus Lokiarchaeota archaeon]|nr:sulfatase-like hydrolase/transferase [Candidatus Lokiarchaeota archaeon]